MCSFETRRPEMDDFERKKNFGGKGKIRRQEVEKSLKSNCPNLTWFNSLRSFA